MARPRDTSFIHDPRAPAFMAAFGVFFFWAAYHTLESQKVTPGRILYAVLLFWVALCSIAPVIVQLAVVVKGRRRRKQSEVRKPNEASTVKEPNQSLQHNAGSRPPSADSPASETPSSPGPRG
jgi:hypothetical protein